MTTGQPSTNDTTDNVVDLLPKIAKAMAEGRDLIEEPTRDGGIFVPEQIVAMAADMEIVAKINYCGNFQRFNQDLLIEIDRAKSNGTDPLEEVSLWLDEYLMDEGKKVLSA